ncbi:MAG TPA: cyclase family protein [bacterium]|nr:cyclase family protein [bacterium]HQO35004.1 cyclase family protein [bacterium]HQP96872.1 cyclase family protein [bacterium]
MSSIIDITVSLRNETVVWPGDTPFKRVVEHSFEDGSSYVLSHLLMTAHAGTHVDAPLHIVEGGKSVEKLDPGIFIGPCRVVLHEKDRHIDSGDIDKMHLDGVERVLFRTRNSQLWDVPSFREDYVALTVSAAEKLVDLEVKLVGLDYLSIGPFGEEDEEIHRILLGNQVIVMESLDLRNAEPGDYELIALPLKIVGGEAAPVRAVLRSPASVEELS